MREAPHPGQTASQLGLRAFTAEIAVFRQPSYRVSEITD
jgi:hypothetical protein